MSNRRRYPPQDYGPLFTPEQIAAIRKARQRAKERAEQEPGEPTDGTASTSDTEPTPIIP